ncbi:MAG: hypothetical protein K1000chlam3_00175 [Chlamydiae bacterium]|nr:hypothetical protein [Chlamydiota bacterium]
MSERTFYLSEFVRFFLKRKKKIFFASGISFALVFLLTLIFSKPHFLAEATFKQVKSQMTDTNSVESLLKSMWNTHEDASAISVMQSKTLLGKVVEEMGLQIEEIVRGHSISLTSREFGISRKKTPFLFRNVSYSDEATQSFFVRPLSAETFEVLDQKKKTIVEGKLHEPVTLEYGSWTLEQMPLRKKCSAFRLLPKRAVLPKVQKGLKIKTSRLDGNLLLLRAKATERETAMGILDAVMQKYQEHLHIAHEELAIEQIRYLGQRRDQLGLDFEETLSQHVAYLQNALGAEGFLGLTQEIEMLSEPKEKYTAQRHQVDLEIKKWNQPALLEVAADHPWKEGLEKRDLLDWQAIQITPSNISTEEFAGIDLETTQKLHAGYSEEFDRLNFQIGQLQDYQERIVQSEFELSALSQILNDSVSQTIIQKGAEVSLQLADRDNRSEKERQRLFSTLSIQKTFLQEHMNKKAELLEAQSVQVERKMTCLKQRALELLQKERANVEQKLAEIGAKMAELPEKWRLESQLKLKKELTMQILEGLTQLSESKVLNRHLFHIESKPLDAADAPLDVQSPHLFLYASMGGLLGAFFFAIGSLAQAFTRGFPLSVEYLRDRKFQVASSKAEIFQRIALDLEPGEILALIGNEWAKEIKEYLQNKDFTTLSCPKPANSPEALQALASSDRFILQLKDEKAEDLVPYEGKKGLCVLIE